MVFRLAAPGGCGVVSLVLVVVISWGRNVCSEQQLERVSGSLFAFVRSGGRFAVCRVTSNARAWGGLGSWHTVSLPSCCLRK